MAGLSRCQQGLLGCVSAAARDRCDLSAIQCVVVLGGVGIADHGSGEVSAT